MNIAASAKAIALSKAARLIILSLALGVPSTARAEPLRFVDWCVQLPQLTDAERHTVEVLLEEAGTQACGEASEYLHSLSDLDLTNRQITTLSPLSPLTQLKALTLNQNQIIDLGPIAPLASLTALRLYDNQIQDLSAIASLTQLATLHLDRNQIEDLSPLANLTQLNIFYANDNRIESVAPLAQLPLTELYLANNQITDTEPLRSLTMLTHLDLSGNEIETVASLASLTAVTTLDVSRNDITQIEALASLSQLSKLELKDNPIALKACPVFPATICVFTDAAAEQYQQGRQQLREGDLDAALTSFQDALDRYQDKGDRLRESDALDRIGNVYSERGEYANALDYYQKSEALRQTIGDPQGDVDTLAYLGATYIRLGQPERAIVLLQRALEQYQAISQNIATRAANREGQVQKGLILRELALAYSRSNGFNQALRFAKLSLADYRWNNDPTGEAIALNRVGEAYLKLGERDKARQYLSKALDLTQNQEDPAGMARSLQGLGNLSARENDSDKALDYYHQARQLRKDLDPAGEGETLNAIGTLLLVQGKQAEAAEVLQEAVAKWESLRPGLTDRDKISIIETQSHTYSLLQQAMVAMGDSDQALEVSERGRSRAFIELLAYRLALRGQPLPPQRIEPPTIADIKAIAQAQSAVLVEYSLVGEEIYIWVVEPAGQTHFRRSTLDESLSDSVLQRRQALGLSGRRLRGVSVEAKEKNSPPSGEVLYPLHQLLIEPIADILDRASEGSAEIPLVIIPHEELFLTPFAALPDREGTVLLEKHPLRFAPAIGLLNVSPQRSPLRVGLDTALVVGDPKMPNQPDSGFPWPQLAGARREVGQIAPLLGATPLMDNDATKAAVVPAMGTASIVHLATHGLLEDFGTGVPGALALAPTPEDDGYLTAAEIAELPMAARLVVLSACDTGQGRITGDGVIGLSRSFLTAGVESVVVSLWAVSDAATAELMEAFYRKLQQESDRAEALRQAMLTIRDRYPDDPTQWAAFTLFGEAK